MSDMTRADAIKILADELNHTKQHLKFKNKAEDYYKELQDIADALKIAINSLKIDEQYDLAMEQAEPKTGHCKDCKWWKDSDGVFRRGIGAESQCPMNRIEVYEGNGYCHMFEPQESEE